MIYGVNLPINRVLVNLDINSYAEMMQLCGRAGRTGRASRAEIIFCRQDLLELAMCATCPHPAEFPADSHTSAVQVESPVDFTVTEEGLVQECLFVNPECHDLQHPQANAEPVGETLISPLSTTGQLEEEEESTPNTSSFQLEGGILPFDQTFQSSSANPKRPRRQSASSKAFRNLTRAAAEWRKQQERGETSEEDLRARILESRVAQELRNVHGADFQEEQFLTDVLRRR